MENLTNRNPTAYIGHKTIDYIGCRIADRTQYSKESYITKFVSIQGFEETAEGSLVLHLGVNGKKYKFEFENTKGVESARRQFLDDIGVWDIFSNVWDVDYRSLVGKKIEAFFDRENDKIAAISPIFMPWQNKPKRKQRRIRGLDNIFNDKVKELRNIVSEVNRTNYENLEEILNRQKECIQSSVRTALLLKSEYMQLARLIHLDNNTETQKNPESYYNFIKNTAKVLDEINKKLKDPYSRSLGLNIILEEIEDLNDSNGYGGNKPESNSDDASPEGTEDFS